MKHKRIAAVVPTYNRKESLRKCIQALLTQSRPLDEIIIIDNNSNDGTEALVKQKFSNMMYIKLAKNTGSAGGFYEGIKRAYKDNYDWIWLMDNDAFPHPDALLSLLKNPVFKLPDTGFLCSHVIWVDGSPHKMNIPHVSQLVYGKGQLVPFNTYLSQEKAILVSSCAWASTLISRKVITAIGLPLKEFFIWVDDAEFTSRITKKFKGYYIPRSIVVHKTPLNINADISSDSANKLPRYFYDARNKIYLHKKHGFFMLVIVIRKLIKQALKRRDCRVKALSIILRGIFAGLVFNPKIEYL